MAFGEEKKKSRQSKKRGADAGWREYSAAAAIQLPWLNLFILLLPIQVCLANFLTLRLRMKPYSMK